MSKQTRRTAAFMRGWSLEATLPRPAEIDALKDVLAPGTEVFLSAIPAESHLHLVDSATRLRRAGFEPVPHIAARNYPDETTLLDMLKRSRGEAGVERVLVIGGDRDRYSGPFASALTVIESGHLQSHGIAEIGVGGYPEGHPRISLDDLEHAFAAKVAAARRAGLKLRLVTQFCFDADHIIRWLKQLRAGGYAGPVRIGFAGPASITTLLRFAQRCGVSASARALMRSAGVALQALGKTTPEDLIKPVAEAAASGELGIVAPHFYSFGGFAATARWAKETESEGA